MRAYEIFSWYYRGNTNLLTPNIIECHELSNGLVVEISMGYGISNEKIYAVTVLAVIGGYCYKTDLSQLCGTKLSSCMKYIQELEKISNVRKHIEHDSAKLLPPQLR